MLFSAGVMLSTSVFNLILPTLDNLEKYKNLVSVAGVFCGAICVIFIDFFVKKIIKSHEYIFSNKRIIKITCRLIDNKNEQHIIELSL